MIRISLSAERSTFDDRVDACRFVEASFAKVSCFFFSFSLLCRRSTTALCLTPFLIFVRRFIRVSRLSEKALTLIRSAFFRDHRKRNRRRTKWDTFFICLKRRRRIIYLPQRR